MFKYSLNYTDYNGKKVKKVLYFNLNKFELMKLQVSVDGGLDNKLTKSIKANNYSEILDFFTHLVKLSYGEKTEDGETFVKSEKLSNTFVQSAAFDQLCNELFFGDDKTSSDKLAKFINGIIPQDLAKKISKKE